MADELKDWSKAHWREKKQAIYDLCQKIGFWNVSPTVMAKELHTSRNQVSLWKQYYIKQYGVVDVAKHGTELHLISLSILQKLSIIATTDSDKKNQIMAARAWFVGMREFTEFLERFGYKPRVPIAIDLKGETVSLHLVKIAQEAAEQQMLEMQKKQEEK